MPTTAEEIAAAKAALAIVQMAERQGWLDKLKDLFKEKHKVIVLGSTGTGKSNFIKSLQQLIPQAINHLNRTQWASQTRLHLADQIFDVVDTPGQDAHRDRRLEAIRRILEESKFGLINVVCSGYHEYATGADEALSDAGAVNPEWLARHRTIEVEAASEWVPLMSAKPAYMITLVTKADLWWSSKDEVLREYEQGDYSRVVHDAAIRGHAVLPYSSTFHRFYGQAPMSGVFEGADRERCQQMFLENLFMSVARES